MSKPKTKKQLAARKRWEERGDALARRENLRRSTEYRDRRVVESLSRHPKKEDLGFFPAQDLPDDWEDLLP